MTKESPIAVGRILVVDDTASIHEDIRKILVDRDEESSLDALRAAVLGRVTVETRAARYEVDSAYQGEEAVALVKQAFEDGRAYHVAFVDMRMPPGWDGLKTIEHLFEIDPLLQVVICSAFSDYSVEDIRGRLGLVDRLLILKKPFEYAEISQLACALTAKRQHTHDAQLKVHELEALVADRTSVLQMEMVKREHDALHDALTDLPNRACLLDRLERCVERHKRLPENGFALMFLDLDNFKLVNDSLGHECGDRLLVETAARLTNCLRSCDTVSGSDSVMTARLGGDEFVILLENICAIRDVAVVAERILAAMQEPVNLGRESVTVTASVGIAIAKGSNKDAGTLMREADTAMYRAKQSGKSQYAVFNEDMHAAVRSRIEMENDLRAALTLGELHVAYQPIVAMSTGALHGVEALLRWAHPRRGNVPPSEFIPIAEEIGLIHSIGDWVMRTALRQARAWRNLEPAAEHLSLSVNVSKWQLTAPEFCDHLIALLGETGMCARDVNLEITESAIIDGGGSVMETLTCLKRLGFCLHMDDFGTGYSSLSCLHQYPFDVIKIDRSFVTMMGGDRRFTAIVHAVLNLARNLNIESVAEGIETAEQLAALIALDCEYAQGFYFSKPVSAEAISKMLSSGLPWMPSDLIVDRAWRESGGGTRPPRWTAERTPTM